jgi:hypothetical protein
MATLRFGIVCWASFALGPLRANINDWLVNDSEVQSYGDPNDSPVWERQKEIQGYPYAVSKSGPLHCARRRSRVMQGVYVPTAPRQGATTQVKSGSRTYHQTKSKDQVAKLVRHRRYILSIKRNEDGRRVRLPIQASDWAYDARHFGEACNVACGDTPEKTETCIGWMLILFRDSRVSMLNDPTSHVTAWPGACQTFEATFKLLDTFKAIDIFEPFGNLWSL